MIDLKALIQDVQQRSDEMRVQLNLAGKEAEQEWNILASKRHKFMCKAQFGKSSEEVGEAAKELGQKMKAAYDKVRNAAQQCAKPRSSVHDPQRC